MNNASDSDKVLDIRNLEVSFRSIAGTTRAVNGVSLDVRSGEIVGLVGESGCGKSVTIRSVVGLVPSPPAVFEDGEIWLRTRRGMTETLSLYKNMKALRQIRGRDVSMIFQEPMRSVHPMMTIGQQITEGILEHEVVDPAEAYDRTVEMLDLVGLPNPAGQMDRYALRAFRRHAPTRPDRARPRMLPPTPARARANHRTRRNHPGPDPGVDQRPARAHEHVRAPHHPQWASSPTSPTESQSCTWARSWKAAPSRKYLRSLPTPTRRAFSPRCQVFSASPRRTSNPCAASVPELTLLPEGCVFADRCPHVMPKCDETPPVVELRAGP